MQKYNILSEQPKFLTKTYIPYFGDASPKHIMYICSLGNGVFRSPLPLEGLGEGLGVGFMPLHRKTP